MAGLRGFRDWRARPSRTIRLRLTALYGSVFLVSSAALLTIGYLIVGRTLREHHPMLEAFRKLGLHPRPGFESGFRPGTRNAKLVHAVSHNIINHALQRLLAEYVIALVLITAVSVVTGWLLAGRALAPLRKITATARRVSGQNLGERIALRGPDDELKELATTFDRMLERLDGAFASQRHFVANASHELRTPLAIMRTEIDVTLADPDANLAELRAMGEAVRDTVDGCERLIASLLLLARSEARTGRVEPLDVAALAGDCVTDLRARARQSRIEIHSALRPAWIDGDPGLLERLIANLLDNAIAHNEPDGWLAMECGVRDGRVVLRVANGGPPLDPAQLTELYEPFRRLHRSVAGFGLGLSIVRSIAEAHRGRAELAAPRSGGLEVTIELPARAGGARPAERLVDDPAPSLSGG
jgi:signal transduction histidine kinase